MENRETNRGQYILDALNDHCMGGDAYITAGNLYSLCLRKNDKLSYQEFSADLAELFRLMLITAEGENIYLTRIWRYEESAAQALSGLLLGNSLPAVSVPVGLSIGGVTLCEEQRQSVEMALSKRLSLILGGAGSGKTSLVRALCQCSGVHPLQTVLCAPTGKAARNLADKTGMSVRTVHSVLGLRPHDDFLGAVTWNMIRLLIVDEVSMMTLEMLAGILCRVPTECRVVLIGDEKQLPAVGAGDIIRDLCQLRFPCIHLKENHRQDAHALALTCNVTCFSKMHQISHLTQDNSFEIINEPEDQLASALVDDASQRYLRGESVQVLSPYRKGMLSAEQLNLRIRDQVNPVQPDMLLIRQGSRTFRDGDRVLITRNDRERNVSNGDIGVLHILTATDDYCSFWIELPDGRSPDWEGDAAKLAISEMLLAYALTVHKSQGSEYDTVLLPLTMGMSGMLNRNLLYTAISRARKGVRIYGADQAVDTALQRSLTPRKSMLVARTLRHFSSVA